MRGNVPARRQREKEKVRTPKEKEKDGVRTVARAVVDQDGQKGQGLEKDQG